MPVCVLGGGSVGGGDVVEGGRGKPGVKVGGGGSFGAGVSGFIFVKF